MQLPVIASRAAMGVGAAGAAYTMYSRWSDEQSGTVDRWKNAGQGAVMAVGSYAIASRFPAVAQSGAGALALTGALSMGVALCAASALELIV